MSDGRANETDGAADAAPAEQATPKKKPRRPPKPGSRKVGRKKIPDRNPNDPDVKEFELLAATAYETRVAELREQGLHVTANDTRPRQVQYKNRIITVNLTRPRIRGGKAEPPPILKDDAYLPKRRANKAEALSGMSMQEAVAAAFERGEEDPESASTRSRRFYEASMEAREHFTEREYRHEEFAAVLVDAVALGQRNLEKGEAPPKRWAGRRRGKVPRYSVLIATGITTDGRKIILGSAEGNTESAQVGERLLRDLVRRGLDPRVVWITDGGKGTIAAIYALAAGRNVDGTYNPTPYGRFTPYIQRCRFHKGMNIQAVLPRVVGVRKAFMLKVYRAWMIRDPSTAKAALEALAKDVRPQYPEAAAAIMEGLEESVTLARLGLSGRARRLLSTTNIAENVMRQVRKRLKKVHRWRSLEHLQRWVAAALLHIETKMQPLPIAKQLKELHGVLHDPMRHLVPDVSIARLGIDPRDSSGIEELASASLGGASSGRAAIWWGDETALAMLGVATGLDAKPGQRLVTADQLRLALAGMHLTEDGLKLRARAPIGDGRHGLVHLKVVVDLPTSVAALWHDATDADRAGIEPIAFEAAQKSVRQLLPGGLLAATAAMHANDPGDGSVPTLRVECVVVGMDEGKERLASPWSDGLVKPVTLLLKATEVARETLRANLQDQLRAHEVEFTAAAAALMEEAHSILAQATTAAEPGAPAAETVAAGAGDGPQADPADPADPADASAGSAGFNPVDDLDELDAVQELDDVEKVELEIDDFATIFDSLTESLDIDWPTDDLGDSPLDRSHTGPGPFPAGGSGGGTDTMVGGLRTAVLPDVRPAHTVAAAAAAIAEMAAQVGLAPTDEVTPEARPLADDEAEAETIGAADSDADAPVAAPAEVVNPGVAETGNPELAEHGTRQTESKAADAPQAATTERDVPQAAAAAPDTPQATAAEPDTPRSETAAPAIEADRGAALAPDRVTPGALGAVEGPDPATSDVAAPQASDLPPGQATLDDVVPGWSGVRTPPSAEHDLDAEGAGDPDTDPDGQAAGSRVAPVPAHLEVEDPPPPPPPGPASEPISLRVSMEELAGAMGIVAPAILQTPEPAREPSSTTRPPAGSLASLKVVAVQLARTRVGTQHVVAAMGVTEDGRRLVLGVADGDAFSAELTTRFLDHLVTDGLDPRVVWVINDQPEFRAAIEHVSRGVQPVIQLDRDDLERRVKAKLPELGPPFRERFEERLAAGTQMRLAWMHRDPEAAKAQMDEFLSVLETRGRASAARVLRDGLAESLAVTELELRGDVNVALRSKRDFELAVDEISGRGYQQVLSGEDLTHWFATQLVTAEPTWERVHGADAFVATRRRLHGHAAGLGAPPPAPEVPEAAAPASAELTARPPEAVAETQTQSIAEVPAGSLEAVAEPPPAEPARTAQPSPRPDREARVLLGDSIGRYGRVLGRHRDERLRAAAEAEERQQPLMRLSDAELNAQRHRLRRAFVDLEAAAARMIQIEADSRPHARDLRAAEKRIRDLTAGVERLPPDAPERTRVEQGRDMRAARRDRDAAERRLKPLREAWMAGQQRAAEAKAWDATHLEAATQLVAIEIRQAENALGRRRDAATRAAGRDERPLIDHVEPLLPVLGKLRGRRLARRVQVLASRLGHLSDTQALTALERAEDPFDTLDPTGARETLSCERDQANAEKAIQADWAVAKQFEARAARVGRKVAARYLEEAKTRRTLASKQRNALGKVAKRREELRKDGKDLGDWFYERSDDAAKLLALRQACTDRGLPIPGYDLGRGDAVTAAPPELEHRPEPERVGPAI